MRKLFAAVVAAPFAAACSAMDQAAMFAVDAVSADVMDPIAAGNYLLTTAFAQEHARMIALDAAEGVVSGVSNEIFGAGLAGTAAATIGVIRWLRGSSFKSGSGNGTATTTPTTTTA